MPINITTSALLGKALINHVVNPSLPNVQSSVLITALWLNFHLKRFKKEK